MNGESVDDSGGFGVDTVWTIQGLADFNGDGKTDILWRHSNGSGYYVWLMNGKSAADSGGFDVDTVWTIQGLADFNGDGKTDLLWQHSNGSDYYVWLMNLKTAVRLFGVRGNRGYCGR